MWKSCENAVSSWGSRSAASTSYSRRWNKCTYCIATRKCCSKAKGRYRWERNTPGVTAGHKNEGTQGTRFVFCRFLWWGQEEGLVAKRLSSLFWLADLDYVSLCSPHQSFPTKHLISIIYKYKRVNKLHLEGLHLLYYAWIQNVHERAVLVVMRRRNLLFRSECRYSLMQAGSSECSSIIRLSVYITMIYSILIYISSSKIILGSGVASNHMPLWITLNVLSPIENKWL